MTSKKPDGGFIVLLAFCLVFGTWAVTELPEPLPECSDGIDNDGDGGIDSQGSPYDFECEYSSIDINTGMMNFTPCPLWMSESNAPQTLQQCLDGY